MTDRAFFGGFGKGLFMWPQNIFKGMKGADRPTVVQANKELVAVKNLVGDRENLREDYQQVKETYNDLPQNIRNGVELGVVEGAGGLAAGMLLSNMLAAFLGRGVANCLGARLGPQHRIFSRTPATIGFAGLLTYFSIVASTINFIEQQNQLLNQNPDARRVFDEYLNALSKRDDNEKKS